MISPFRMINLLKLLHLFLLDLYCEKGAMLMLMEVPTTIPYASIRSGGKQESLEKKGVCNSWNNGPCL